MDKIKKIIMLLVIIIIIIALAIIFFKIKYKNYVYESKEDSLLRVEMTTDKLSKDIRQIESLDEYFKVKNCINSYYSNLNTLSQQDEYIERYGYSQELFDNMVKDNFKIVYSILDKEYLDNYKITEDNIINYFKKDYKNSEFYIYSIYKRDLNENIIQYIVYGKLRRIEEDKMEPYGFIINTDKSNITFSMYLYDYMIEKNILEDKINNVNSVANIENIELNEYNRYQTTIIDEETCIKEYFDKYKEALLYDEDRLYNLLDDDYKNARFASKSEFLEFIKNNSTQLYRAMIEKYKVDNKSDYIQYIYLDQNGRYYIFRVTSPMNYKIILDTYTIDLPEFTTKYNQSNNQEKCALNIQKFMQAINEKDYNYAYNCLSQGFKNNYFKDVNQFKEYIENNFYDTNKYEFTTFEEQSGLYTYKVKISNAENEEESITKTFVVKLNEGTKFELSFNKD